MEAPKGNRRHGGNAVDTPEHVEPGWGRGTSPRPAVRGQPLHAVVTRVFWELALNPRNRCELAWRTARYGEAIPSPMCISTLAESVADAMMVSQASLPGSPALTAVGAGNM